MDLDRFRMLPLMGILRGVEADIIDPVIESAVTRRHSVQACSARSGSGRATSILSVRV